MSRFRPAKTARGLRTQESRLNTEITICNLALDRLELAGIDNPKRSISDKFTPLERGVYNAIQIKLSESLKYRRAVWNALRALGIPTQPAQLDNRR